MLAVPVREARINHGDLDTVGEKQQCARLVGMVRGQPPCNIVMCQERTFSRRTAWRLSPAASARSHLSGRMETAGIACVGCVRCTAAEASPGTGMFSVPPAELCSCFAHLACCSPAQMT